MARSRVWTVTAPFVTVGATAIGALIGALGLTSSTGCGDLILEAADGGDVDGDVLGEGGVVIPPLVCDSARAYPNELGCTGLYADWPQRTISPTAREYRPSHEAYADGADRTRWIELPAGTTIDVSDANEWTFPVGTKLWMEFRLTVGGRKRRVETRFLWKSTQDAWVRATYQWSADETTATEVIEGVQNVGGGSYEIPSQQSCTVCHGGRKDFVLGFEAVLLTQGTAGGFNYGAAQAAGVLSSTNGNHSRPPSTYSLPGSAVEQQALGYLHANCGIGCHSGKNQWNASQSDLVMRLDIAADGSLGTVPNTNPAKNTINRPLNPSGAFVGGLQPGNLDRKCRILPLNIAESAVHWRMNRRDSPGAGTAFQMPPLGSHVVDAQGVAALGAWINAMQPGGGYPVAVSGECEP